MKVTPARLRWIRREYPVWHTWYAVTLFRRRFKVAITEDEWRSVGRLATSWLTDARFRFLAENHRDVFVPKLREVLQRRYRARVSYWQVLDALRNLGLEPKGQRQMTAAEKDWVRARYAATPRRELLRAFEAERGWAPGVSTLQQFAMRNGLRREENLGCYQKGRKPGPLSPAHRRAFTEGGRATRFKRGESNNRELPLHSTRLEAGRLDSRNGKPKPPVMWIKVEGPAPYPSQQARNHHQRTHWTPMGPWVWEQAGREIPPGHVIIHLDGDPANNEIGNLECVPKGALAVLNNQWSPSFAGKDANPARIRLAQLRHRMGQITRERADA